MLVIELHALVKKVKSNKLNLSIIHSITLKLD